jgi:hypothetical protein
MGWSKLTMVVPEVDAFVESFQLRLLTDPK